MSLPANGTPITDLAIPVAVRAAATGDPRIVRVVVPISNATVQEAAAAAAEMIAALDVESIKGLDGALERIGQQAQADAFVAALIFG